MITDRKQLGSQGEELICQKLQQEGYTILERNYIKKGGEIDIIAQKKDLIAFIEVKTRRNPLFDTTQVIMQSKQKKMINIANRYLIEHTKDAHYCRFDVAVIEYWSADSAPKITYIADAFMQEYTNE